MTLTVFDNSLDFKIEVPYETAMQFIRRIGGYNNFEPDTVTEALGAVDSLIPRRFFNEGNPNNGERAYKIIVGREGSPVIYIERYEWFGNEKLSDGECQVICREMELIGKADEADYWTDGHKLTFRFWWD